MYGPYFQSLSEFRRTPRCADSKPGVLLLPSYTHRLTARAVPIFIFNDLKMLFWWQMALNSAQ
jgi:hypothetical protein